MAVDQFVFRADEGLRAARITLTGGASEELAVHAAGLVALGRDHVQAAVFSHSFAEANVGAAPGHVGGNRDAARLSRQRDNHGLFCKAVRVKDLESPVALIESP